MSLSSSRPGSPTGSSVPATPVGFECGYQLDSWGSASLELRGELDRAGCEEFEARLAEAQRASTVVNLDLSRLTFMDSAGYAVLYRAARDSRPEAKLLLTGCCGQVDRLLGLLGLPEKVAHEGRPVTPPPGPGAASRSSDEARGLVQSSRAARS